MIPDHVIQSIKDSADIFQTVSAVVVLKRAGAAYKGLCPFHQEKTPSFTIDTTKGTYHCFGCGEHGDSLKFLQKTQQLSFPEAVRQLGAQLGIEVPEERVSPAERKARERNKSLAEVHDGVMALYEQTLARSPKAQGYLQSRELSRESAEAFHLGWAPNDVELLYQWMSAHKISADQLLEVGVLRPSREGERVDARLNGAQLRFKDRLVCPIFNMRGHSIGFSGRIINPHSKAPKYLNTGETHLFTKGKSLYGLSTARAAAQRDPDSPVILCEGNLDVISLWQAGFKKSVAPMGTALTEDQARLIKRLGAQVIVLMDGDQAGLKASFKSLPIMIKAGINARFCGLNASDDPDSFLKREGPEALKALLATSQPLFERYVSYLVEQYGANDTLSQLEVMRRALPLVAAERDDLLRPLYLNQLAQLTGLDRAYLTDQLREALARQEAPPPSRHARHSTESQGAHEVSARADAQGDPYSTPYSTPDSDPYGELDPHSDLYDPYGELDPHGAQPSRHSGRNGHIAPLKTPSKAQHQGGAGKTKGAEGPRSWWEHEAEKLNEAARNKRWGDKRRSAPATGAIDLQTRDDRAPFAPPPSDASLRSLIPGYEREGVRLLYYHPHLIPTLIERGAERLWSSPLTTRFIAHLYERYSHSGYVASSTWLNEQPAEESGVAAALRDALAEPPPQMSPEDLYRALNGVIHTLLTRSLEAQYQQALAALREAYEATQTPSSASSSEERSSLLAAAQARYHEARAALNQAKAKGRRPSAS